MLLNADVGEGLATDARLIPMLNQASVACGGHTGDQQSMAQAVKLCKQHKVQIGAHPSYPDRTHFGRRSLGISAEDLFNTLFDQIDQLWQVCQHYKVTIDYVKPHGALYNDMVKDFNLAESVCAAVQAASERFAQPMALMVSSKLYDSAFVGIARKYGVHTQFEAFLDRAYKPNGELLCREEAGAVFDSTEQILRQAHSLVTRHSVVTSDGELQLKVDSLCLHGDNEASVSAATEVRELLNKLS